MVSRCDQVRSSKQSHLSAEGGLALYLVWPIAMCSSQVAFLEADALSEVGAWAIKA